MHTTFRFGLFSGLLFFIFSCSEPAPTNTVESNAPAQDTSAAKVLKDMQEFYFGNEADFESGKPGEKVYAEIYDEEGRLMLCKKMDGDRVYNGTRTKYDKKGQVIEIQNFAGNSAALTGVSFYEYDANGNEVSDKSMTVKGPNYLPASEVKTTYNADNTVSERVRLEYSDKTGDMEPKHKTVYTYNEKGKIVKIVAEDNDHDSDEAQRKLDEFTYEGGKMTKTRTEFWIGQEQLSQYKEITVYREDDQIEDYVRYFRGKMDLSKKYSYDEEGRLVEKLVIGPNSEIEEKVVYTYQSDGKLLTKVRYLMGETLKFQNASRFLYHYH